VLEGFKWIGRPVGRKRVLFFFWTVLFFLASPAFAVDENPSVKDRIIPNVPFFPQEMYQCGPASLAEIFHFWGKKIFPEEIASEIYSKSARGTLTLDMVLFPERNGFAARQFKGDISAIQKNIDAGYPLVVMVDLGFSFYQKNHFLVIFGYNENGLYGHSGKEESKFLPIKSFLKTWEKTNFWTLLITPNEHEK
jgi:ABC-type bacteriocin/lantibiotic exporter with double-glycine peptidase domain